MDVQIVTKRGTTPHNTLFEKERRVAIECIRIPLCYESPLTTEKSIVLAVRSSLGGQICAGKVGK